MVAAADRLLDSAKDCRGKADWHEDQASVGPETDRRWHTAQAHDYRLIGITLALVAEAFQMEPEE